MIPLFIGVLLQQRQKIPQSHKAAEIPAFHSPLSYSLILLYNVASEIPSSFAAFLLPFHIPSVQQQRIFDLLPFKAAHPLFQRHVSL